MEQETAEKLCQILTEAGMERFRMEFSGRGEPTVHPGLVPLLRLFRMMFPKATMQITTNGRGIIHGVGRDLGIRIVKNLATLLQVTQVNIIALDDYGHDDARQIIRSGYPLRRYPDDPKANPWRRTPAKTHELVVLSPIKETTHGAHSAGGLCNHCGAAGALVDGFHARCARPFRDLVIGCDGLVQLCCEDFRRHVVIGNVMDAANLDEIWNGPLVSAYRRMLMGGRRELTPCLGCNAKSKRVGLLPDTAGQRKLGPMVSSDRVLIRTAVSRGPFTTPVMRPWDDPPVCT